MHKVDLDFQYMIETTGGLEVKKWLDNECTGSWKLDILFDDNNCIITMRHIFENEIDAMAFKLRWL